MKSKKLLATVLSAVITFSTVSAVSAAPVGKESKSEPKTTTIFGKITLIILENLLLA